MMLIARRGVESEAAVTKTDLVFVCIRCAGTGTQIGHGCLGTSDQDETGRPKLPFYVKRQVNLCLRARVYPVGAGHAA